MPNRIGEIDGSIVRQAESESVFCFRAGAKINADGDPRAYHPGDIGRDYLANAGRPGNWWAIATDNGKTNGNPVVQGKDEPAPGYYVSMTSLADPKYKNTDQRRYVDSSKIPFFVLPRGNYFGAKLGDFGVVLNHRTGKYCGGIFADSGPPDKIGEVSIALAEELAVDADPKDGGSSSSDYLYVVFPGSGVGWPLPAAEVKARAGKQFTDWGGFGKLAEFYPDLISTTIKPINRGKKTMASIQLRDVFQYYKGLPHQLKAIDLLQNRLASADMEAFAEIWRSAPESAPVDPVYQVRFTMATGQSSSLLTGKMEFLLNGAVYNTITATSSLPGRQYSGAWSWKGGLIPPTSLVKARTGKGWKVKTTPIYMPNIAGVSGNFYPIEPFEIDTDGATRGDFGIHFDANTPGSLGCVCATTEKGWAATQRELKGISGLGIRAIDLIVEYA